MMVHRQQETRNSVEADEKRLLAIIIIDPPVATE